MQTIHCTTSHFIRHEGNLVDLTEYRRRLAQAQTGPETAEEIRPVRTRRRSRRILPGLVLDWAASIALIITALSFAVKIL